MNSNGSVKNGYLVKCAKGSARNWRKRYFVLNGNSITYHIDHENLKKIQGDILLVDNSKVEEEIVEGVAFPFRVSTPFESMLLAAKSADDREAWISAIRIALEISQYSLRGYMLKRTKGMFASTKRKFFILHQNFLSIHTDHEHTKKREFVMTINEHTILSPSDEKHKLFITDPINFKKGEQLIIQFESRNERDYPIWRDVLLSLIKNCIEALSQDAKVVADVLASSIQTGFLQMRPPASTKLESSDPWNPIIVHLTDKDLVIFSASSGTTQKIEEIINIYGTCTCSITNFKPFSFQISTSKKILHFNCSSDNERQEYVNNIKKIIAKNIIDLEQNLFRAALEKVSHDEFYSVTFEELKPLGIALEKCGEWASVKSSNYKENGIHKGSILTGINGDSVILEKYTSIMPRLKDWAPPFTLSFRRAPEKRGYLMRKGLNKWAPKYFILSEGKLKIKDNETEESKILAVIDLGGSVVLFLTSLEVGKHFCFKILTGVSEIILQASDLKDMLDWTSTLHHAISLVNGGLHVIHHEQCRIKAEEERFKMVSSLIHDEEQQYVVDFLSESLESNNLESLKEALDIASEISLEGELIEYAKAQLQELIQVQAQYEADNAVFEEANMVTMNEPITDNNPISLDHAYNAESISSDVKIEESSFVDEDEIEHSTMGLGQETMRRLSLIAATKPPPPKVVNLNIASSKVQTIQLDDVCDDEEEEEDIIEWQPGQGIVLEEGSAIETELWKCDPASEKELLKLFMAYAKRMDENPELGYFINVMQFSSLWRIATGERGNLFKEMQMFNQFDTNAEGAMNESDFVKGWMDLAEEMQSDMFLRRITFLVGGDNIVL